MQKGEPSPENQKLTQIIQAYSHIWAEVILNKNLMVHLNEIKDDLGQLKRLISERKNQNLETLPYCRIADQLFRLKEIINDKLNGLEH